MYPAESQRFQGFAGFRRVHRALGPALCICFFDGESRTLFPFFLCFFKKALRWNAPASLALVFLPGGWYTESMEIQIYYFDKEIAVCRKPVGVDSEAAGMPALLARQLRTTEVYCVHRLDRAVGGLMVYALRRESAAFLSREIQAGRFRKEYLAVVHGRLDAEHGELRDLLFHDRAKNKSFVVRRKRAGVKEAVLDYRVLSEAEGFSLLAVRLQTGRTHQIRVQFASRAHPLAGDVKYGSPLRGADIALFSHALGFRHPVSGEALAFTAPPPGGSPWEYFENIDDGGFLCDTSK